MIDIIIPTHGQEAHTLKCLRSMREHTEDYRVIWVDNGSSAPCRDKVMREFVLHANRVPVWIGEGVGFVKAVNAGLDVSLNLMNVGASHVVICNNDIEVCPVWLDRMTDVMRANPTVAAVGPVTSNKHASPQWWEEAFRVSGNAVLPETFGGLSIEAKGAFLSHKYPRQIHKVSMLCFFCTVFRTDVFEALGVLDERFGPGYGDDDDFCMRMQDAGMELAIALDSYVEHNHRTTFKAVYGKSKIAELQQKNRTLLMEKHGRYG